MVKKYIQLGDKDRELLHDIYNLRTLSANQIKRAYYGNSWYGYNRIRELEGMGYLDSRPLVSGRKKETQCYFITDKGIREIQIESPRKANKNKSPEHLLNRQILINEVYIIFKQIEKANRSGSQWEWRDSRDVKEKYQYNRRDLIAGQLINKTDGKTYGIYIPSNMNNLESQCTSIKDEIERHESIRTNIILCPTLKDGKGPMKYFNENMKSAGASLRILPHSDAIGLVYNTLTHSDQFLANLFKEVYGIPESSLYKENDLFATHSTSEFYYAELLTNDIVLRNHIKRYGADAKGTKPIKVVCWTFALPYLQEQFRKGIDNKKIILSSLNWSHDQKYKIATFIETSVKLIEKKAEEEKRKAMAFTLPTSIREFISTMNPGTRSEFIERVLMETPEFKKFSRREEDE